MASLTAQSWVPTVCIFGFPYQNTEQLYLKFALKIHKPFLDYSWILQVYIFLSCLFIFQMYVLDGFI